MQENIHCCRLSVTNVWKPEDMNEIISPQCENLILSSKRPFEFSDLRDSIELSSSSSSVYSDTDSEPDIYNVSYDNENYEEEDMREDDMYNFPISCASSRPLKSSLSGSRQCFSCSASSLTPGTQTPQSSNKRLTFLTTLEAIPQEQEMLAMKRLAKMIHISFDDPKNLYPSLITFSRIIQDVCRRANYWSWAPNFMMFLALFINGSFGNAINNKISRYAMYLFSFFCCSICKYDPEREPPLYDHFVYVFIPQLLNTIGKWSNNEIDPSLMTLSYVFYKVPVGKEIIEAVIAIREKGAADFFSNKQEDLRYQRALWLCAISHQLVLNMKQGKNVEINKANFLICYEEVIQSHNFEKSLKVAKIYEQYFDVKSEEYVLLNNNNCFLFFIFIEYRCILLTI